MDIQHRSLVIFDLDGTVVDTLEPTFRCFQDAVEPHLGRRPTREEVLARFGPADQRIVAEWVGEAHAEEAVRRLYACYEEAFREAGPFPGMVELIEGLRGEGRRTALFTGRGRPSTDAILRAMGLEDLFEVSVTGEEAARPKPAPHGLLLILERLGVAASDAVYIGDTVLDMQAAKAAGVAAVAALWASPDRERLAGGEFLRGNSVDALRDLLLRA